jgi:preprotein translocase subunit SecE
LLDAGSGPQWLPKGLRALLLIGTYNNIMANPPQVETISTGADKAKLAVAGVLVVAAVVAFYMLAKQDLWMRVAALIVLLAAAVATFFTSEAGKQLIAYGRDSAREVRKVVWPTRNEALQMTGYVFAFVVVMALFLFLTDKTLEWLLYDLILGWKR